MNNDGPILSELRKISAWADMQRKMTKWSLIFIAVFIPALIIFGVLMERRVSTKLESVGSEETPDWYDVDQSVRRGDFDKAIQIGEKLIVKTPLYPEAHRRLAGAYLAAGDIEKARQHYAEAFRLFPSEENEKSLAAIDRRIRSENPQQDGAATGSQPIRTETNRTSSAAGSRR
jgi:tetratricopeptide (TPR) repeat protein